MVQINGQSLENFYKIKQALVAELADALVSGTSGRKAVEVQVLSRAIVRNEQLK